MILSAQERFRLLFFAISFAISIKLRNTHTQLLIKRNDKKTFILFDVVENGLNFQIYCK